MLFKICFSVFWINFPVEQGWMIWNPPNSLHPWNYSCIFFYTALPLGGNQVFFLSVEFGISQHLTSWNRVSSMAKWKCQVVLEKSIISGFYREIYVFYCILDVFWKSPVHLNCPNSLWALSEWSHIKYEVILKLIPNRSNLPNLNESCFCSHRQRIKDIWKYLIFQNKSVLFINIFPKGEG